MSRRNVVLVTITGCSENIFLNIIPHSTNCHCAVETATQAVVSVRLSITGNGDSSAVYSADVGGLGIALHNNQLRSRHNFPSRSPVGP